MREGGGKRRWEGEQKQKNSCAGEKVELKRRG